MLRYEANSIYGSIVCNGGGIHGDAPSPASSGFVVADVVSLAR